MADTTWTETRFGGYRRTLTGVAQKMGKTNEADLKARAVATVDVDSQGKSFSTQEEQRPDSPKIGGSNPSPRTKKVIIKLGEHLGLPSCPYVIRWRIETPWFSIRLHHWLAPDDDRAVHDHPWNFTTFVLKGGYRDYSPSGDEHLRAPTIRYRKATHQHTVFPDSDGAWTIIITGPKIRSWGFWVKGKFIKMNKYFLRYGHHPCN